MYPLISEVTNDNIMYCGLLTTINYLIDENKERESLRYLCEKFISKDNYNKDLRDLSLKYTIFKNDKYYINFNISDIRNYVSDKPIIGPVSMSELKLENFVIQVLLDVNNRNAFNKNKEHKTTKEEVEKMLEITKDIISTKLDSILEKGDIRL